MNLRRCSTDIMSPWCLWACRCLAQAALERSGHCPCDTPAAWPLAAACRASLRGRLWPCTSTQPPRGCRQEQGGAPICCRWARHAIAAGGPAGPVQSRGPGGGAGAGGTGHPQARRVRHSPAPHKPVSRLALRPPGLLGRGMMSLASSIWFIAGWRLWGWRPPFRDDWDLLARVGGVAILLHCALLVGLTRAPAQLLMLVLAALGVGPASRLAAKAWSQSRNELLRPSR